jgi:pimeloyl-ACP methyl ester carboxylesterase
VSAVGPYREEPELLACLPRNRRELVELARRDPEAAEAMIRAEEEREVAEIARDPEAFLDEWPSGTPESDREAMADPVVRARFVAAFRELGRTGPSGAIRDTILNYVRPWGFSVASLTVPVHLWHGDADAFVPVGVARYLAGRIPNARLIVYAGEGHAVDFRHIDEILHTLAACLG